MVDLRAHISRRGCWDKQTPPPMNAPDKIGLKFGSQTRMAGAVHILGPSPSLGQPFSIVRSGHGRSVGAQFSGRSAAGDRGPGYGWRDLRADLETPTASGEICQGTVLGRFHGAPVLEAAPEGARE